MVKLLAFLVFLGFTVTAFPQAGENGNQSGSDTATEQLVSDMEYSDVGFLWSGDNSQNSRLGFVGENYRRLQIRFLSVIKNYDNPFEYFLYGKSKTGGNICQFQGSLVMTEVGIIEDGEFPDLTRGYASGDYVLFEDQVCSHSGVYRGSFTTTFYVDKEGTFHYDDIYADAPRFANNEFTGEWQEYYSDTVQVCNWGDHRIPEAEALDAGIDSFYPAYKYQQFGWKDYLDELKKSKEGGEVDKWWE